MTNVSATSKRGSKPAQCSETEIIRQLQERIDALDLELLHSGQKVNELAGRIAHVEALREHEAARRLAAEQSLTAARRDIEELRFFRDQAAMMKAAIHHAEGYIAGIQSKPYERRGGE